MPLQGRAWSRAATAGMWPSSGLSMRSPRMGQWSLRTGIAAAWRTRQNLPYGARRDDWAREIGRCSTTSAEVTSSTSVLWRWISVLRSGAGARFGGMGRVWRRACSTGAWTWAARTWANNRTRSLRRRRAAVCSGPCRRRRRPRPAARRRCSQTSALRPPKASGRPRSGTARSSSRPRPAPSPATRWPPAIWSSRLATARTLTGRRSGRTPRLLLATRLPTRQPALRALTRPVGSTRLSASTRRCGTRTCTTIGSSGTSCRTSTSGRPRPVRPL
mmetsp:Transcript_16135/g.46675  ORF Transcript_16135/g.46675 Transcript_16135/m.46675 type:complete len:274 (+) Transcript_16135:104-925(+)